MIMATSTNLEIRWTTSRGRDTYGYNVVTLYVDGEKAARCNGGGYDMEGTVIGTFIARAFADRLNALTPADMPEQSHWQRAENPRRVCREPGHKGRRYTRKEICPHCGTETDVDYNDGKRIDDGRYFYGLSFIDPNFDASKAVVDRAPVFGTEADAGKTVEQLESEGKSLGLERYQQFWKATEKHSTERNTVPHIDGACGKSCVEKIAAAIGLTFEYVPSRSKNQTLYILRDSRD